jgi:hypothetical protein
MLSSVLPLVCPQTFSHAPDVIRNSRFHCGRDAQRFLNPAEAIEREISDPVAARTCEAATKIHPHNNIRLPSTRPRQAKIPFGG